MERLNTATQSWEIVPSTLRIRFDSQDVAVIPRQRTLLPPPTPTQRPTGSDLVLPIPDRGVTEGVPRGELLGPEMFTRGGPYDLSKI